MYIYKKINNLFNTINIKSYCIIFILFSLIPIKSTSTENNFTSFSVGQGLSHTHILSIYQDSKGYLWIGTYGGLNLYNGYSFHLYLSLIHI